MKTYRTPILKFLVARDSSVKTTEKPVASDPRSAAALAKAFIPDDGREHFVAIMLNTKNSVIGIYEVSVGTVDRCPVFPREIAKAALLSDATGVIVAHNHPSGSTEPSIDDMNLDGALKSALKTVGITLHDSLIVTHESDNYFSSSERRAR